MKLNPFFLYAITWLILMVLYNLKISSMYPKLSLELLIYILISVLISILISIIFFRKSQKSIKFKKISKAYFYIYMFIFSFFIIEFIYEGQIPLMEFLFLKKRNLYGEFKGIKFLHLIMCTYNFYITLCAFNDFQYTRKIKYLFYSMFGLLIYVLLYTRGTILMLITCSFFIWISYSYKLKTIIKMGILGIVVLYIFGILGNIRHYYSWNDTRMIKTIAKINTEKSILDPLMWSYVYITSPLGNLQYNLDNSKPDIKSNLLFMKIY